MLTSASPQIESRPLPRLSVMMFLQYAIWGAWLPLLWPFLTGHRGFTDVQVGNIFAMSAVGAIIAPFVAGQIADRWFATEKFLALSHILGAILVWQLASVADYQTFLWLSLLYSLIYSPTLSLTNSLAMHHLDDLDRDLSRIRVWGTIGWIVVGITMAQWFASQYPGRIYEGMGDAFRLSGILGIVMGIYSFTLPHTPPEKKESNNATIAALKEIRRQPLLTLFLLAIPVSCIHQFYFVHTAGFLGDIQQGDNKLAEQLTRIFGEGGGGLMTIGQMSEIIVLSLIPILSKHLNRKKLLMLGLFAYAARMALFSFYETVGMPGVLLGVAMHGLTFGCFIFVSFMVVDENTTSGVRASAQSLYSLIIFGIGIIVGSQVAGRAAKISKVNGEMSYEQLFSYPLYASLICLLLLFLFYPNQSQKEQ